MGDGDRNHLEGGKWRDRNEGENCASLQSLLRQINENRIEYKQQQAPGLP